MGNFLWVLTDKRQALLDKLIEIPEAGRKPKSELIEMAVEEFVLKHGTSQNPQTKINLFDKETIAAVPNLYADREDWEKFYKLIKSAKDKKKLDEHLNLVLSIHNKFI